MLPRLLAFQRGARTANGKIERNVVVRAFAIPIDAMHDDAAFANQVRSKPN
ncbi:hypothetical protein ACIBCN_20315 [Nocardia sp. NPDC051052]|uniref:hypothetical protein n=1 Tax=Nocardia sp. NPDC051052 TaxID=3364322 RepID=UPI0037A48A72